jgi:hypothetical protein
MISSNPTFELEKFSNAVFSNGFSSPRSAIAVLKDNFNMELSETEGVGEEEILATIPKKNTNDNMDRTIEDKKKPNIEPNTILQNFLLPDSRLGGLTPII